ncbi:MAG TPA: ABC transporter ATP-binding protein, partial [Candidatus Bathyarchaeota archaeon]|nr:ABC transporter ATP-binding protein [Candidatus Bathyarchaeota archaeon]
MSELRRVMGFARPYRRDMLAAMVLLGLVVLADVSIPRLVQVVIDEGVAKGDLPKVVSTSLLMVGASILSSLFMVGNTVFAVRAARGLEADLRERLFNHIQEFSFSNLDSFTSGQLITRLTSDISQIQGFLLMLLRMFTRAPLMFVGSLAMMVATDLGLAKVMVSLVVFTALLVTLFINRVSPYFERVQRRLEWLNQVVRENLEGVRVVKAFVRQDYEKQRFDEANQRLFETQLGFMQLLNAFFPLVLLVMNLGVVAIIYLGGLRVYAGSTSVGTIMAFTNYVFATMFPVMMLGMMAGQISAASASSARIMEVLDTEPTIKKGPNVQPPSTIRGEVRFEDVEFSYQPDGGVPVLQGISFTAEPGERVAILGATGSGKSSLVSLIPRFYDVTKGSVKVDGVDVREWDLEALRSQIGFCLQESVLFTGTVADNIRWGRRDASMEEVVEAAKLAQAHE